MDKKQKVILLTPVIAHYRKDIYNNLIGSDNFDFEIIGGVDYLDIENICGDKLLSFKYFQLNLFKHKFFYLKGALKHILSEKPDVLIISGIDFHLIHTILIYFIYRIIFRKRVYWWSQGGIGHQGKIGLLCRKILYKLSTGVMLYSRQGSENLLKMGINPKKLRVINNSLNEEDYGYLNYDIIQAINKKKYTILYVGRITKAKKMDVLVNALGYLKQEGHNINCSIVGDGDLQNLINLAKEKEVFNQIEFVGAKYGKDAHHYFMNSDLFVYPGGIGLSIVHAFSFGLPTITTDDLSLHGPEIELLMQGENGNFYENESSIDLAGKILEWRDILKQNKDNIKRNCIQSIKKNRYLPNNVSDELLNFITN